MGMTGRLQLHRKQVPNLVVAQHVISKMTNAASDYLEDETGEAMVGVVIPGTHTNGIPTLYVLDTIAPDDSAVRMLHTFQQGDERQDELIWWLQENWRAYRKRHMDSRGKLLGPKWDVPLRYLGDWHKQPGYMIQPSQGDLMTALNWITDQENGMDFLLAPIVTLDHPSTTVGEAGANFVTVPRGDDTCLRIDFWYLDHDGHDFLPIAPAVYPDEQLPRLPEYPWHLVSDARFNQEYQLLEKAGFFNALVLWDTDDISPLEICFLTARMGADHVMILITPWDYPNSPPRARLAPYRTIRADDDLYKTFEELWKASTPVDDPPDWTWNAGRHLVDYLFALEQTSSKNPGDSPDAHAAGPSQSGHRDEKLPEES